MIIHEQVLGRTRDLPATIVGAAARDNGDVYLVLDVDYTDWLMKEYGRLVIEPVAREMVRVVHGRGWAFVRKGGPKKMREFIATQKIGAQGKVSNRKMTVIEFPDTDIVVNRTQFDGMEVSH